MRKVLVVAAGAVVIAAVIVVGVRSLAQPYGYGPGYGMMGGYGWGGGYGPGWMMRGYGGGYLEAAVAVSSKFIPSGPIVSVESRASNITTLEADDTAIPPMPLVVLVDRYTASASEITSGAIQDSSVGTIMGERTFGKGVVQTIYPLPDGSAVKITTARYLTPRNRDINHLGITPDVVVAENKGAQFGNPAKDDQLTRAMQFINAKLAQLQEENGTTGGQ